VTYVLHRTQSKRWLRMTLALLGLAVAAGGLLWFLLGK
jgi:hypothetical protein